MKEKNRKKKGESSAKPRWIVAVLCVLLALSVILDYFNISQILHIDMSNFNWDFLSIFVGNLVVVGLYYLTYWLIDRHNIKRTENQERNVKTVINEVYKQCNKIIALLENEIGIVLGINIKSVLNSIGYKCYHCGICQQRYFLYPSPNIIY